MRQDDSAHIVTLRELKFDIVFLSSSHAACMRLCGDGSVSLSSILVT